jgi:tetratricopeptide (TPR) repeat protein
VPPEAQLASSLVTPPASTRADVAEKVIQSLEEGRFERARDHLDELLLSDHLTHARSELARGSPEDALLAVDRALAIAPDSDEARLLKADGSLRLAEAKIEGGGAPAGLIEGALEDALAFYLDGPESAHALFGASRAAWLLGRLDEALGLARRGMPLLGEQEAALGELSLPPRRLYAEQVLHAHARARSGASPEDADEARALFREAEEALAKLLGRAPNDPWAWSRLADLYEGEGRLPEALSACERGLERASEDAGLLERLARVSRKVAGAEAAVLALEAYVSQHPKVAAGHWHLAVARFDVALEGYQQEPRVLDPSPFTAAEASFRALRARPGLAEHASGALGYEVVSRLARGWCALGSGDLALARREFLSMNELLERGIEWRFPGVLESGIQGLFLVADAHASRDELEAAGEVFETLHVLQPDQYLWANNAGFFLRDAATGLELEGKSLCRAARGRLTNAEALAELRALAGIHDLPAGSMEECAAFAHAADERFSRARVLMERSWRAYRPAAELASEDVRVVNDAALVLVYYLHRDLEWAEQALLRCVELGGPQIEAKKAALALEESPERASALEKELALLTEAWGDAHQNLGVLAWVHRKDAVRARTWLEKALEIWPARQPVTNSLLPQVRGELAPEEDDQWDLSSWARPCPVR